MARGVGLCSCPAHRTLGHAPPAPQAQRYISQLKGQVNALEAELEEQRKQKQKALVDNEQLRHELSQLRAAQLEGERNQGLREEAESACAGADAGGHRVGVRPPEWGSQPPLPPQRRLVPRRHATTS